MPPASSANSFLPLLLKSAGYVFSIFSCNPIYRTEPLLQVASFGSGARFNLLWKMKIPYSLWVPNSP